ncbi:UNVERIFIED_CONTAM: hypothetical protein Cloal_3405 [Acetivibrio alkalicellulosi]
MRIKEAIGSGTSIHELSGKEDKKTNDVSETSFKNQLKRLENHNFEERIKCLVGQIESQGQKLGKKVDMRELKLYKKLISEFLAETTSNSYKFLKDSCLDRRGRYKVFARVKKINEELEDLTRLILSEEMDNISILKKIEDIRGLILDLII